MSAERFDKAATGWVFPRIAQATWDHLGEIGENSEPSRTQAAREIVDRANAEKQTTDDYGGRYPIELLQNAHDACEEASSSGRGQVWFHLTDTALIVANEGTPFDENHVEALMRYGASTKAAEKTGTKSIGYKGVGFSSVFEITKNPQIISNGIGFQLHRERGRTEVENILGVPVEKIPLRGYPLHLTPDELGTDAEVVNRLITEGAATVIRLPLDDVVPAKAVAELCNAMLQPETMIFMAGIDQLSFGGLLGHADWRRTCRSGPEVGAIHDLVSDSAERSWLVVDTAVDVDTAELSSLEGSVWENVTELNVAVGIPWTSNGPDAGRGEQTLHVYFPTDVSLGRSLIVHGDFLVDSSRKHLLTGHHFDVLNERLRLASADLLAEAIEALVPLYGAQMLQPLKPVGEQSPFGRAWWDDAQAELKSRKIIALASGAEPVEPGKAVRVAVGQDVPKLIAQAVPPSDDRVHPDYEMKGIQQLLSTVGVESYRDDEIAKRLEPSNVVGIDYSEWLDALAQWTSHIDTYRRASAIEKLRASPILRGASTRKWQSPKKLLRATDSAPPLPAFCAKDVVELDDKDRSAILDLLEIESLDTTNALRIVIEATNESTEDDPSAENQAALEYIRQLWQSNPGVLKDNSELAQRAFVQVRSADASETTWRRASDAYFGSDWLADSLCEPLYGPIGEAEFLTLSATSSPKDRDVEMRFYRALGVASEPRRVSLGLEIPEPPYRFERHDQTALINRWCNSEGFGEALRHSQCRNPPYLFREEHRTVDRLKAMLENSNTTNALSLAQFLAKAPGLLDRVDVRCGRSKHDREADRYKTIENPEAFLIRTTDWLPTEGGDFASPNHCWAVELENQSQLLLRKTTIPPRTAKKIGVPTPTSPTREAIEFELRRLQDIDPELEHERVVATATFLVDQLGRLVAKESDPQQTFDEIPFPARKNGGTLWSTDPLIADLDGVDAFPGIEVLIGSNESRLAKAYGLVLASDDINVDVLAGERLGSPLLTIGWKVDLVAYLAKQGGNLEDLARWIGRLDEYATTILAVRLTSQDGTSVDLGRDLLLEETTSREGSANVKRGTLYRKVNGGVGHLSKEIARYIQSPQREDTIEILLIDRDRAIEKADVIDEDLAVAREALAKYAPMEPEITEVPSTTRPVAESDEQPPTPKDPEVPELPVDAEAIDEEASGDEELNIDAEIAAPDSRTDTKVGGHGTGVERTVREPNVSEHGSNGVTREPATSDSQPVSSAVSSNSNSESIREWREQTAGGLGTHGGVNRLSSRSGSKTRGPRTRERLVSYVLPDDPGSSDTEGGSSDGQDRTVLGNAGVTVVKQIEEAAGRTVEEMPHSNPGFDLRVTDVSGERLIEVKATTGEWDELGVAMTATEFEYAEEYGEDYWLYVVEHALTEPIVHRIQDPFGRIGRYMFDSGWRAAAETVTTDRDTSPDE